ILGRLAGQRRQVRADGMTVRAEAMTGGTALEEHRLAAGGIAGQREGLRVGIDDLAAIGIDRAGEDLGGEGADLGVLVIEQALATGDVDLAGGDSTRGKGIEEMTLRGRSAQKKIQNLRLQWRCEGLPAAREKFRRTEIAAAAKRGHGDGLQGLRLP